MKIFKQLPSWCLNFYVLVTAAFVGWMLLLDTYDWVTQCQLYRKIERLKAEKEFYQAEIKVLEEDREALEDPELLEKLARERYLMKRPKEDLYLVKH